MLLDAQLVAHSGRAPAALLSLPIFVLAVPLLGGAVLAALRPPAPASAEYVAVLLLTLLSITAMGLHNALMPLELAGSAPAGYIASAATAGDE